MKVDPKDVLAVEFYSGHSVRRVACKICGQMLYDHEKGDSGHPGVLMAAIASHLEFSHSYRIDTVLCSDENCCPPEERPGKEAR